MDIRQTALYVLYVGEKRSFITLVEIEAMEEICYKEVNKQQKIMGLE